MSMCFESTNSFLVFCLTSLICIVGIYKQLFRCRLFSAGINEEYLEKKVWKEKRLCLRLQCLSLFCKLCKPVNHALSGKSVLQMLKLNSRTDQILAANAVDHFFWRKDLRNISDYNFDKPKKKKACTPAMHGGQMDIT